VGVKWAITPLPTPPRNKNTGAKCERVHANLPPEEKFRPPIHLHPTPK